RRDTAARIRRSGLRPGRGADINSADSGLPRAGRVALTGARARRLGTGLAALLAILSALAPGPGCVRSSAAEAPGRPVDLEAPPETRYRLAPFLTFGAEIELVYEFRHNLDLDRRRDDDASLLTPELSLALSFAPDPRFQAFLNVALSRDFVLRDGVEGSRPSEDVALEVKEAFVWARSLPGGLSVQLGRQRFEDEREWLYDEELDAVRVRYEHGAVAVELSASRNGLVRKDVLRAAKRDRINNYVLHASYRPREDLMLEAYAIARDDRGADRQRPVFLGARSRGEPIEDLDYWLELGYVGGRNGPNRLRGWGVDLGATYELQVPLKPALTVGLAFGSGDRDADDGIDRSFRQTGLQDNEADFGGAASFKYYGEALDPELSNLAVFTAGLGVRPSEKFSLDLVYHYYLQHRASEAIRGGGIDAEPSGRSRRLGSGVDFVVGVQEITNRVDGKLVLGYFMPGAAFPERTGGAWVVRTEVQFRF
ncbi:MAG: alginate export family protein, partial [Candidatus Rokuibacteriota bacterium]